MKWALCRQHFVLHKSSDRSAALALMSMICWLCEKGSVEGCVPCLWFSFCVVIIQYRYLQGPQMGQHLAVGSSQLEDGSCAVLSPDFQDHILIFSLFFFLPAGFLTCFHFWWNLLLAKVASTQKNLCWNSCNLHLDLKVCWHLHLPHQFYCGNSQRLLRCELGHIADEMWNFIVGSIHI